jgi:hypothetical protein
VTKLGLRDRIQAVIYAYEAAWWPRAPADAGTLVEPVGERAQSGKASSGGRQRRRCG